MLQLFKEFQQYDYSTLMALRKINIIFSKHSYIFNLRNDNKIILD